MVCGGAGSAINMIHQGQRPGERSAFGWIMQCIFYEKTVDCIIPCWYPVVLVLTGNIPTLIPNSLSPPK